MRRKLTLAQFERQIRAEMRANEARVRRDVRDNLPGHPIPAHPPHWLLPRWLLVVAVVLAVIAALVFLGACAPLLFRMASLEWLCDR